jgi:tetratricopeptide (TPR) repeat protein
MLAEGHSLEALQLADTGLAARRKHYPEGHLAIAASQYLKARALINLGRYEEASKLIAISAGIRKQNLGQNHPAVAQCLYCHAVIREIQGYPLEALEELKLTLELRSEHADTPAGHREIIESIIALAINAEKRGAYKKAQDLYERALKLTLEQLAGRGTIESLDVAEILVSLGNLYRTVGRYTDAAAMLGKAGIMICRMYGDDHLKLADCLYALAELAKATGQYRDAKVLLARCVTLRKE